MTFKFLYLSGLNRTNTEILRSDSLKKKKKIRKNIFIPEEKEGVSLKRIFILVRLVFLVPSIHLSSERFGKQKS